MRILYALAIALIGFSAFADGLPDLGKTPGVSRAGLSKATICATKWGTDARHVTQAMKNQVFALYGYSGNDDAHCEPDPKGHRCEIDHLISRELGGADDVENLWPEAYGSSPYNAHLKDKLENRLHKEMCAGHIGLKAARDMLVNDWRKAYRVYYGTP
jgi:hypothetical protein